MRCAIYARVSTKDRGQEVENQLVQLRKYADAQGWEIYREFIDHESGKHAARADFQALFTAASRREFDVVLVWALDRFSREGVAETFIHLKRLHDFGVEFESFTEKHFRTSGEVGTLLIGIMAWVAKQERQRISDRTKAGLATARAKGRVGGRPARVFDRARAAELRAAGWSWRAIAREIGIAQSSIRDVLRPRVRKPVRKTPAQNY